MTHLQLETIPPVTADDDYNVKNVKHTPSILHIAVAIFITLTALAFVSWLITNPRFEWDTVADYLFTTTILRGVGMTLLLTAVCMTLGSVLGVVLALMKISNYLPFRALATGFVWFFRSVPMLVQLIFWFNLSYLIPRVGVGVPFGPEFFTWNTNDLINAFTAAVIGLTIHEAAYMAEIVRSGLLSVDPGQRDAARALGYKERTIFLKFILPQALRVIIPPTGSQVISLLKGTSLVSVIGMTDLLHAAQNVYNRTFDIVPLLLVASIWYMVLIGVLSIIQAKIEKRLSRGYNRSGATAPKKKIRKLALPGRPE